MVCPGTGTIYAWSEAWHPYHPDFRAIVPYVVVLVDLDAGVRLLTRLVGLEADDSLMGRQVVVEEIDLDGRCFPIARCAEPTSAPAAMNGTKAVP